MRFAFAFLALFSLIAGAVASRISYAGHRVYRLHPTSIAQINALKEYSSSHEFQLDWWEECRFVNRFCDVRVPPSLQRSFSHYVEINHIQSRIMIDDVEKTASLAAEPALFGDSWFTAYHDYPTTISWLQNTVGQYPKLAKLREVGYSYENRTIFGVEISGNGDASNKPTIFIDGGIHAREWISPATVQYVLYTLLSQYSSNSTIAALVDSIRWVIIPIFNVDGYQYTHTTDRMWRKTRRPNPGNKCVGTDPCRNSPVGWGQNGGASTNPCADDYAGPNPLSEVEVESVLNYALSFGSTLKGYINFHSYSQLFMSSYGYTSKLPPTDDYNKQIKLGKAFVNAIYNTHGKQYTSGPIYSTIYPASGVISDTVYAQGKVVYSYSAELRDTGAEGFLLKPDQIIPSGEEIFAGLIVLANQILSEQNM